MTFYDTYRKTNRYRGEMHVKHITSSIVLKVRNLKETLYFYEGILGLYPSSQRPQLDV
ncbi:VOC family protein, partial [Bacillus sp. JJ1127]